MTGEETAQQHHADLMSLFNNCLRRNRRNAIADIFECLGEDERTALFDLVHSSNTTSGCEENGDLSSLSNNAMEHSAAPCDPNDHQDINIPNDLPDNSEENDRLSGLLSVEESCVSFPPNTLETARPSCLVGLKPASSTPSSSSSFTSTSSMSPSQQTPSFSNSNNSSSSSSPSSASSSSSEDEEATQSCCSSESITSNNHGCTTTTASASATTSPSCSSSSSTMIRYNISFSRVRRNALHNLLETLTQDDMEKLKNLYQTTLYSLKPFSDPTQSPIRSFHECKA